MEQKNNSEAIKIGIVATLKLIREMLNSEKNDSDKVKDLKTFIDSSLNES